MIVSQKKSWFRKHPLLEGVATRIFRQFCRPAIFVLLIVAICTGCSQSEESKLAVAKMSTQELQNTPFLALNDDIPGTPVTVQNYLVPGKFTIVYYYSPYSEEDFKEALSQLVIRDKKLAVRTININREGVEGVDWESPVVEVARLNTLPYFFIYDLSGSLRAHGRPAYEQIVQWVKPPPVAEPIQNYTVTEVEE